MITVPQAIECSGVNDHQTTNHHPINQRKYHELHISLSTSVALSQELQTKSDDPNPAGREARVPTLARRPANQKRMNANNVQSKFAAMGARIKVREIASRWRQGVRA
jgi:hypothetical protein